MTNYQSKAKKALTLLFVFAMMIFVLTIVPGRATVAAPSKYVKSLKTSKSKFSLTSGSKKTIKATVKVTGSVSKKVKVSLSKADKMKVSVKVGKPNKKGVTQITITAKKVTKKKTAKVKITTVSKNKKNKKITKTIRVTVNPKKSKTEKSSTETTTEKTTETTTEATTETTTETDSAYTVSGRLKSKSGNIIKENLEIGFVKKSEYQSSNGWSTITCSLQESTGAYSIDLGAGEYVVTLEGTSLGNTSFPYKNEVIGEVTVTNKNVTKDLVFDGYYISGTWLRNDKPMDEKIHVDVYFSNGSSAYVNSVTVITPDKNGKFYFLCDSYYSEYDKSMDAYGFDVESLRFSTDFYNLMTVSPYEEDLLDVTWENDYYIVRGTVLNHGDNQIYDLFYSGLSNSTYLCNWSDSDEEYEIASDTAFDFSNTPDRDEIGDYEFTMRVPTGTYKLKIGTAMSTNEIEVNKDVQDFIFEFDVYKVSFEHEYTGEAGNTIEASPTMYIYQDGEEIYSASYEYIDYEPIYLSPGTYDIRLSQEDTWYPKKITEFTVTDSDIHVSFSY